MKNKEKKSKPTVQERFDKFVDKTSDPDGCWLWKGATVGNDPCYGGFIFDGKKQRAHRVSWILEHGQIPDGMCVLHHCDQRLCVRVSHLFLGTNKDNYDDMMAKHRNGKSGPKLTKQQRIAIALDKRKLAKIAKDYGITMSGIGYIKKTYAWVRRSYQHELLRLRSPQSGTPDLGYNLSTAA